MATPLFSRVSEFDPDKEEWPQYVKRLDHFFAANQVQDATLKREIFLSMLGPTTFKVLSNIVAPADPGEKTYKDLVAALKKHYNPEPAEVVQRLQFYARDRLPGESVSTFVSELRSIAIFCNFGETLDKMLRDRLVGGINNVRIRRRLLQEKHLDFVKALEIAQGMEAADKNEKKLDEAAATAEPVQKLTTRRDQTPKDKPANHQQCYRCGKSNHKAASCRFKTAKCYNCGRVGHVKAVCRSKTKMTTRRDSVQQVFEERETTSDTEEYSLHALDSAGSRQPFVVNLHLDDVPLSMELDTGASLSIMAEATFRRHWPDRQLQSTTRQLRTYTGEKIKVLGTAQVHVRHGANSADLPLMVVEMDGPSLLGRNWMNSLRLDWSELHRLHDGALEEVLRRHSRVFQDELGTLRGFRAKIHVDPNSVPQFCRCRPVPYSMRPLVEAELERLVKQKVIEPVTCADWAAPIVPVLKADKKSVRICGDFSTTVNKASQLDRYPIPRVEDLFAKLRGGKSFTKLDMSQAYLQLELDDESKKYVVVNTHKGLFQYNRLPFGVSSAPGIFQRAMESLLGDIPSVVVYLDDILVTGVSDTEHIQSLEKVLDRLESSGLRLKKEKCIFTAPSVTYLGHKINKAGIYPTEDKIRAVQQAPAPKNVSGLKAYLGLLNYYGKFMPNLATTLNPLYRLLQATARWSWGDKEQKAFEASKKLLLSSQVLAHYNPEHKLVLACDASPYGLGAVLSHRYPDGQERPIGYASRTLSTAEQKYSQIEKEGLACVFGVKRFHCYLYGRPFTLVTDHKPLTTLFSNEKTIPAHASARIQRWALTLGMYEYHLMYKAGSAHGNADALSRLPLPGSAPTSTPLPAETVLLFEELQGCPVTAKQIRIWTSRDPVLSRVLQFVQRGWPTGSVPEELRPYWHKRLELSCQDGCLLWGSRVVVPAAGQNSVLEELHEAHPGATRMKQIARTMVWWLGIDKDIEQAVKSCSQCQTNQSLPQIAPLHPWRWPTRPWSRLHADFAGPIQGQMLLVLIDAHSKWIEAHPMSTITSTATAQCCRKVFATFGVPEVLVTDNGPSFVSEEFEQFLKKNAIRHKKSPPYHPATNGLAERAIQTVKKGLKKMKSGSLQDKLSRLLFRYRNTPQSTTGTTPSQLLLGRRMRSPLDAIHPDLHKRVEQKQLRQEEGHTTQLRSCRLEPGDPVYARNFSSNSANPWLPGHVTQCEGTRSFRIALPDGRTIRRHLNHLRRRSTARERLAEFNWDTSPSFPDTERVTEALDSQTPVTSPTPSRQEPIDSSDPIPDGDQADQPVPTPVSPTQRRYPARNRRQPDRYAPYIYH